MLVNHLRTVDRTRRSYLVYIFVLQKNISVQVGRKIQQAVIIAALLVLCPTQDMRYVPLFRSDMQRVVCCCSRIINSSPKYTMQSVVAVIMLQQFCSARILFSLSRKKVPGMDFELNEDEARRRPTYG